MATKTVEVPRFYGFGKTWRIEESPREVIFFVERRCQPQPMMERTLSSPQNLLLIASAIGTIYECLHVEKSPRNVSKLTGVDYIHEILHSGNPITIKNTLRMPICTFQKLCEWAIARELLRPRKTISVEEQVAIFMKIVDEGASNRDVQDRFQHSGDTIHRHF